ncbi:MAG: hypothetical protein NC394_05290 [Bacteroides sp.]|nr:hypothetical protein [Bacteroides sp.]
MAIEKMSLVHIEGALKRVNKTLMKCCESNCFHAITAKGGDKDGSGGFRSLKSKSPFTSLVNRAKALADELEIEIRRVDYDDVNMNVTVDFDGFFKGIESRLNELSENKRGLEEDLKEHSMSLMRVEKLSGFDTDFSEVFACKYVKLRFGMLPLDSVPKLEYYSDRNFMYYSFSEENGYAQILYLTPAADAAEVDNIFSSLFFERIHLPDYFHGNADEAKTEMIKLVTEENERLEAVKADIRRLSSEVEEDFLKAVSKLIAIDQSYDLRQNVTAVNNKFYMSGYVPKRKLKEFIASIESVPDVRAEERPLDSEPNSEPPVLLRNNRLFRPFEMFIKMYGLPNYSCFDPTPYVAVTYMLIFGIMFGDVGQGLLITVLGIILDKWRKVKLAPIMQRIGITSAIFGVLYGSVFGNEEIIQPFFKIPTVYKALGYTSAPEDIFRISSLLLIAAIGIGVVLVLISMAMNIATNIRKPNRLADAIISPNGVIGMVFYAAVMAGVALQMGLGITVFTAPYVICLIILPLALLFFKEPIVSFNERFLRPSSKKNNENILHAAKAYSDAVSDLSAVNGGGKMTDELVNSRFIKEQYGEIGLDEYGKIKESVSGNYVFYPFENDGKYVTGMFITSAAEYAAVEKAFLNLGFKKMKTPEHISDISKAQNLHLTDYISEVQKEHKSVGSFIVEGIIELFESCLTYITNTMSFLRIGGFILSHAGMMLVVSVLAETAGSGAIVVQILGNLFVIGVEGFLVGIQVLRLEFYEIFSRFYKGDGKPFNPIAANYSTED